MSRITYEEALERMRACIPTPTEGESVPLADALGRVVAAPLVASEPHPRFDNSAVDGYAVGRFQDAAPGTHLVLETRLAAGAAPTGPLGAGTAARVLTGSVVPQGCFAVAMQEDVEVEGEAVVLKGAALEGQHIRRVGDDFEAGAVLLEPGTRCDPGAIGLAASQGRERIEVWRRPTGAVLTTGDELVAHFEEPPPGSIRDSNGPMLAALLRRSGACVGTVAHVRDDRDATLAAVATLSAEHDVLVCAGGASVGDRDHVPSVVAELGSVEFHGVAIRPGKPVLLARVGGCLVFGLPGNPASAFVTFELFAREALARIEGDADAVPAWVPAVFDGVAGPSDRDEFVRCRRVDGIEVPTVRPVGAQGSFGLRSLAGAHVLARIRAGTRCQPGDSVSVMDLG